LAQEMSHVQMQSQPFMDQLGTPNIHLLYCSHTFAATLTLDGHISRFTGPNCMLLVLLESPGCVVSMKDKFSQFGPAVWKLWPKPWRLLRLACAWTLGLWGLLLPNQMRSNWSMVGLI